MQTQSIQETAPGPDALTADEQRAGLTADEKAQGLTLPEKQRGLTLEQKRRNHELSGAHAANPDPKATADLKARHDREETHQLRETHLNQNPQHRTVVDNNPMKVSVIVNRTSHLVPPGPISVADFKRMTRLTGDAVAMNGRALNNEAEQISLVGGEVFTSGDF